MAPKRRSSEVSDILSETRLGEKLTPPKIFPHIASKYRNDATFSVSINFRCLRGRSPVNMELEPKIRMSRSVLAGKIG
jgi:hypothetical protein